ncbi:MAG TPA: type II secretion system F family protein [Clostridia bacterium]|nr:type II secretion system F family protein [Clostridia bacterium]
MAKIDGARHYDAQELSAFCAELALVLRSGMFLPDGVAAMAKESGDPVVTRLNIAVQGGSKLAPAMKESGVFPEYMVGMVELGEAAGKLEQVMDALSLYYEREHAVRNQIKSAVFYPMALVGIMIVVIAVLLIKVLPVFADVFADLGGAAGAVSPDIASFGTIAGALALALALMMLVFCAYLSLKLRSAAGYAALMRSLARLGFTRKLADKIAAGRFAFALSMLLESGYALDEALAKLPGIVENDRAAAQILSCRERMADGVSFAKAVEECGLFSGMYAHILGVGFRAGALESVTAKVAAIYEDEIDRSVARLVGIIEPALVALLCAIIGAILLGVMLPLMNIMAGIG